MGCCCKIFGLFILVAIVTVIGVGVYFLYRVPSHPIIDHTENWRNVVTNDTSVRKFEIVFDEERVERVRRRLSDSYDFHPSLENTTSGEYGIDVKRLMDLIDYWRDDYLPRVRERQDFFNKFEHFMTNIQG